MRAIADHHPRRQAQPREVRLDARRACRVDVQRDELREAGLEFHDVAGLAARRRAGVEHAHAGRRRQEARRELGGGVLHGNLAVRKAGQRVNGHRLREPERLGRELRRLGCEARFVEPRKIILARTAERVHAQPHRRLGIACGRNRLPLGGPVAREGVEHPFRMGVASGAAPVRRGEDSLALAQAAAQDRVDEARGARAPERARRFDGFRDRRMFGRRAMQ